MTPHIRTSWCCWHFPFIWNDPRIATAFARLNRCSVPCVPAGTSLQTLYRTYCNDVNCLADFASSCNDYYCHWHLKVNQTFKCKLKIVYNEFIPFSPVTRTFYQTSFFLKQCTCFKLYYTVCYSSFSLL